MTDKNKRKLQAKKARSFWTCARPVTQIVPNKRAIIVSVRRTFAVSIRRASKNEISEYPGKRI